METKGKKESVLTNIFMLVLLKGKKKNWILSIQDHSGNAVHEHQAIDKAFYDYFQHLSTSSNPSAQDIVDYLKGIKLK